MNAPELHHTATIIQMIQAVLHSTTPVREALHRHGNSYRGLVASTKGPNCGSIPHESVLAGRIALMLDLAPEVMSIIPEPGYVPYPQDDQLSSYIPDYLVLLRNGQRCLIEVKYQAEAAQPENKRRYDTITPLVEQAGGLFAVFTENTLKQAGLRINLPQLERHRFEPISDVTRSWIATNMRYGARSFAEVTKELGRATVLAAIAQGLIRTDIRRMPIDSQSPLWRA
ncbi:hypothetical protein ABGV49_16925 [Chromobacterium vaccinii]|uniref:TnsA endonuclease N-terminal domain-containing protein n=1 Tax=Chromobacterium vaccinii TaxID=1108595 RepID=A0ABV0FF77_9NEIS